MIAAFSLYALETYLLILLNGIRNFSIQDEKTSFTRKNDHNKIVNYFQ